jgi:hypothetical protein
MWIPKGMDGEAALIVKWIHDYHAENRLEGDHIGWCKAFRQHDIIDCRYLGSE